MRTRLVLTLLALTPALAVASTTGIATWRRIDPPMLSSASMAFDPYHRRFLLFGGETIRSAAGDTVTELQGKTYVADLAQDQPWTELALDPSPGARAGALTIYDAKRDRFVIAGGRDQAGELYDDVWAFEFTPAPHWTLLGANVALPAPVYDGVPFPVHILDVPTTPALYDSVGDRMLAFANNKMFSLSLGGAPLGTFATTNNMPYLSGASVAADFPNRKIYAVQGFVFQASDTIGTVWELRLDDLTWIRHRRLGSHPGQRLEGAMALDAAGNRLVLAGGFFDTRYETEPKPSGWPRLLYSFALDGSDTWTVETPAGPPPFPARQSATTWDPVSRSLLLYGGYAWPDVYRYQPTDPGAVQQPELYGLTIDGTPTWSAWSPPGVMEARHHAASAVDLGQRRWFVFGGNSVFYGGRQHDLFEAELDHPGGWRRVANGGPTLDYPVMVFTGSRLVLEGGFPSAETWSMDVSGSSRVWTRIAETGSQPPASTAKSMAYDATRDRVMLFQPNAPFTVWTLNPADASPEWTALQTDPGTPTIGAGWGFSAVWDSAGDRAILPDSGWVLDFKTSPPSWTRLSVTGPSLGLTRDYAVAWDAKRHRVLTFGGDYLSGFSYSVNRLAQLDMDSGVWSDVPADGTASPPRDSPVSAFDPKLDRWLIASSANGFYSPLNSKDEPDNQVYVLWMDSSTPARLSFANFGAQSDGLRLRWAGGDPGSSLRVWRRNEGGESIVIGTAIPIEPGLFEFTDRSVVPGERYGYRLEGSDGSLTNEEWIALPVKGLELAPLSPNPTATAWSIRWSQPRTTSAELVVIDAAGRRVLDRTWNSLAAGRHTERVEGSESLAPGLYFILLRSGGETSTRRAVRL